MVCFIAGCASTGRTWSALMPGQPHRPEAVIPGSWDKVEALRPGSPFVVILKGTQRLEGDFKALGAQFLILTDRAGKERSIPISEVDRIVAPGRKDPLTNGIAIGAGVGLGAAIAILTALGSQDGYVLPSAKVGAPLMLTGAGGLVGALVDRARVTERVLYRVR
jgi:hypothetical protein